MKHILFALTLLTGFTMHSIAQTKGCILLYGVVGYSETKTETSQFGDSKQKILVFNPGIGYQFADNWTAGVNFAYASEDNIGNKITTMQVGPFLRYTQMLNGIFFIYGQVDGSYQNKKYKGSPVTGTGFNGKIFPGLFINIKNGFGLNFDFGGLEYQTLKVKQGSDFDKQSSFAFTFGKNLSIGISKNFGGRKK